ncbi:MAG: lipid A phosphate methyltransferase [Candidatus Brocadiaceae bacterium]|nr:lipid A phosphate methyltransferase [Candidatus Brocadiaceae bacterium]
MALRDELIRQGRMLFRWRTYLPLLFVPVFLVGLGSAERLERAAGDAVDDVYDWACVAISLVGLGWRAFVSGTVPHGTSGRNTRRQKAAVLNTSGAYSVVRHPLYLGNFLVFLGVLMSPGVPWLVLVGCLSYMAYYERIMLVEEEYLGEVFGTAYRVWSDATPAFLPRWSNWRPPELPFCARAALKKEYATLLGVAVTFAVLDHVEDWLAGVPVTLERDTVVPALIVTAFCLLVRLLHKHTRALHVPAR